MEGLIIVIAARGVLTLTCEVGRMTVAPSCDGWTL